MQNKLKEIYPCLTPVVRISTSGQERILANVANGKWMRVDCATLDLFQAKDAQEILMNCTRARISDAEAKEFIQTLLEYGFIVSDVEGASSGPLACMLQSAYLNVTNYCNMRCKHCYFGSHNGLTHGFDEYAITLLADRIYDSGIRNIVIAGGEPLTRPDIRTILTYCSHKGFQDITLLTNGTLITSELATVIATTVDCVHVSLDGPDEDINAKLRGKGNFAPAIEGIHKLKRAGVRKIRIITSISSTNIAYMPRMKQLCDELSVELGTSIFATVGRGKGRANLTPNTHDLLEYFLKEAVALNCNGTQADPSTLEIDAGVSCGSGVYMVSVDCLGNVYPCHLLHRPDLKIGNLLEQEDLLEMLRTSSVAARFRERTVENRKCHGCKIEYFCKGGCLAHTISSHQHSRDPMGERDPYCKLHLRVLSAQIWE